MTGKEMADALHAGRMVLGTAICSASPHWPALLDGIGLDFVFLDTEHIPQDRVMLSWMCRAYGAMGMVPIVRVPAPDPYQACMTLDGGAAGVVFPYVEMVDDVKSLYGATKLRPLKGRKLREALDGSTSPLVELVQYLHERNANNLVICNIESVPAVEALDELLDVPGIDAVLVGPHDLSVNLGIPEKYDSPIFMQTVQKIFEKARDRQIGAGIHIWTGLDHEKRLIDMGANLLVHSTDIFFVREALRRELPELRLAAGQTVEAVSDGSDAVV